MGHDPIDRNKIEEVMGLTPMQEGILYHYLMDPKTDQYYEQYSYTVNCRIDISCFINAWKYVLTQNEVLRTTFRWENISNPVQMILKDVPLTVSIQDVSHLPDDEKEKCYRRFCREEREKGFALDGDALFKVLLGKLEEERFIITVCNHHILFDGWSNGIILSEFITAYISLLKGIKPISTAKPHFSEFIRWIKVQDMDEHKKYWAKCLEGYGSPGAAPGNERKSTATGTECLVRAIDEQLLIRLKERAGSLNITLSDVFTAAWGILLQITRRSDDVVFGTVVSGRTADIKGIEHIVGLLMNTIPIRICSDKKTTVNDVLMNYHRMCQERKTHEAVPLAEIQSLVGAGEQGLFDSLVVVENYPIQSELGEEFRLEKIEGYSVTNYPLLLAVNCFDTITLNFIYQQSCYEQDEIVLLTVRYLAVLELIADGFNEYVSKIKNLTPVEKELNRKFDIEFDFE